MGEFYCASSLTCGGTEELDGRGYCSEPCPCKNWERNCVHSNMSQHAKEWKKITNRDELLLSLKPQICKSKNLQAKNSTQLVQAVELINGTVILVNNPKYKVVEAQETLPTCAAVETANRPFFGSITYCSFHKCNETSKTYCYYRTVELLYLDTDNTLNPIKAYGTLNLPMKSQKTYGSRKPAIVPCEVKCTKGGISFKTPVNTALIHISAETFCFKISFPKGSQMIPLPLQVTARHHTVYIKAWKTGFLVMNETKLCQSTIFCELID